MKVKRLLIFLCTAALLQGLMLLFCTGAGLLSLYPLLFRLSDEEFQTKGTSTVYFDMRLPTAEAEYVVVGMDFGVTQSYDVVQHLLRFFKQYKNITTIYLDGEWAEEIVARMEDPMIDPELPTVLLHFADTLSAINAIQPPQKKFTVSPWNGEEADPVGNLILMDRDRMMENREMFEADGALCVEMKYVNCPNGNGIRQDIDLPFAGNEVRLSFLSAVSIDWFYDYYRKVTNLFGVASMEETAGRLEEISADFVICIANGTEAPMTE